MGKKEKEQLQLVPGTTSKILWHFTGGRNLIDPKANKRSKKLKSDKDAFRILKKILKNGRPKVSQEMIPF